MLFSTFEDWESIAKKKKNSLISFDWSHTRINIQPNAVSFLHISFTNGEFGDRWILFGWIVYITISVNQLNSHICWLLQCRLILMSIIKCAHYRIYYYYVIWTKTNFVRSVDVRSGKKKMFHIFSGILWANKAPMFRRLWLMVDVFCNLTLSCLFVVWNLNWLHSQ